MSAPRQGRLSAALERDLVELYADLDREVAATGVVCWLSGHCCDFEKVDHVLYASGIEVAWVQDLHPQPFPAGSKLCPFWERGICSLRDRRPLGCRTYFCDPAHRDAMEALHERYLTRLKDLAERHGVDWRYAPFVAALRGAAAARPPAAALDELS